MSDPNNETQKKKILSPKIDVIFKLLFGDKRNVEILTDFLESVLNLPSDEYDKIVIEDTHLKRESLDDKMGIVDVRIATKSGKIVHIEIQVLELPEMPERITYYNSKMLSTQLGSGSTYDKLQKTISIAVLDFEIIKESTKYHHVFHLRDKDTDIMFTDLIEIHTLELKKLPRYTDNTKKYEWLRFLKAEKEEDFMLVASENPMIKKAYVELKRLSSDEEAQRMAENREKALRDEYSRSKFAYEKGVTEGKVEGIKEGIKEGKIEAALNIIAKLNSSLTAAMEVTGLPEDEREKLINELKRSNTPYTD